MVTLQTATGIAMTVVAGLVSVDTAHSRFMLRIHTAAVTAEGQHFMNSDQAATVAQLALYALAIHAAVFMVQIQCCIVSCRLCLVVVQRPACDDERTVTFHLGNFLTIESNGRKGSLVLRTGLKGKCSRLTLDLNKRNTSSLLLRIGLCLQFLKHSLKTLGVENFIRCKLSKNIVALAAAYKCIGLFFRNALVVLQLLPGKLNQSPLICIFIRSRHGICHRAKHNCNHHQHSQQQIKHSFRHSFCLLSCSC